MQRAVRAIVLLEPLVSAKRMQPCMIILVKTMLQDFWSHTHLNTTILTKVQHRVLCPKGLIVDCSYP